MTKLRRIDPRGCGCTDCIVGESKPIDRCDQNELQGLYLGYLTNASNESPKMYLSKDSLIELIEYFVGE